MSILTSESLFARFASSLAEDETGKRSKLLKYQTDGAPTVYLAYVFEDWGMAGEAAGALATCGADIHCDWSAARLFDVNQDEVERLRIKLGNPDAWLVALVSERTKDIERIRWALDLARETMQRGRFALLPVRCEPPDWTLPAELRGYPRIEARGDDLVRISPESTYQLPLRRWFRMPS